MTLSQQADAVIIGGGIAGITTALELLNNHKSVILIERGPKHDFGGLAPWAFGGIFLVNSKYQRWGGIKDNVTLAWDDWQAFANYGPNDDWPKKWGETYVNRCTQDVGAWLNKQGVGFFPVVHWVEKGLTTRGNSVPRFHMVWGTGYGLTKTLIGHLLNHTHKEKLTILFDHCVEKLLTTNGRVTGVHGTTNGQSFEMSGDHIIVATGGMGGAIERVKKNWATDEGTPPEVILNGAEPNSDGLVHDAAQKIGANITHLDWMWNYPGGIHHPKPRFKDHGLSLIPPKSALWVDSRGKRIGPLPIVTGYDGNYMVKRICELKQPYTWQILNYKIMLKELAISGSEHNESIRDKSIVGFLKTVLTGNKKLVEHLLKDCIDFVTAKSFEELAEKMNALSGNHWIESEDLKNEVLNYDALVGDAKNGNIHDKQMELIAKSLKYRGDKARTCKFQKINDENAYPLIAIREFILSRKTLGGIQTNLSSQALYNNGAVIPGLYAVGEAAGFGGGGSHGRKSLEGTFLGGCILTARIAAESIVKG
ncbi:FAD-binding dehydrogenase [bacterium]|nr:FAD-binding dehydrogenase [bacterium]